MSRSLNWITESVKNLNSFNFNPERIKSSMVTGIFIAFTCYAAEFSAYQINAYFGRGI